MMDKKLLVGVVALVVLVLGLSAYTLFSRSVTDTGTEATLAASRPSSEAGQEGYAQPGVERAQEPAAVTQEPGTEQETSGARVRPPSPGAVVETPQVDRRTVGPPAGATPADSTRTSSRQDQPAAEASPGRSGQAGDTAIRPAGGGSLGESFRTTFRLVRTFQGLTTLEEGETPLTTAQAKSILALMEPLRAQESLPPQEATSKLEKLEALLTPAQREALEETRQRRPGGGRRNRDGGGPGERAPTGDRPARQRPAGNTEPFSGTDGRQRPIGEGQFRRPGTGMENMNPFNLASDNPMAQRMSERIETVFDALKAKAGR